MNDHSMLVETPACNYACLLLRLHELIAKGQGDSAQADALRDQMDGPWHALTEAETERLGGLSEDLDALCENREQSVPMTAEERRQWGQDFRAAWEAKDWDKALVLLRRPPGDAPGDHIAFFQSECWEQLGCPEVALRFMRSATRIDASRAASVLTLWRPGEVA